MSMQMENLAGGFTISPSFDFLMEFLQQFFFSVFIVFSTHIIFLSIGGTQTKMNLNSIPELKSYLNNDKTSFPLRSALSPKQIGYIANRL